VGSLLEELAQEWAHLLTRKYISSQSLDMQHSVGIVVSSKTKMHLLEAQTLFAS